LDFCRKNIETENSGFEPADRGDEFYIGMSRREQSIFKNEGQN
jgi:hypothetical protein